MSCRLLFSAELQADLPDHWTVQGLHIERSYPFVTSSEGGVTPLDLQAAARAEALHQGQV